DLAVIVTVVAGAVLWVEHGRRIDIATPTAAAFAASVGAVCPDSENVPYSADCIVFMRGENAPNATVVVEAPSWAPATSAYGAAPARLPDKSGQACPANIENVPYSEKRLRFLSGWFWQANPAATSAPK